MADMTNVKNPSCVHSSLFKRSALCAALALSMVGNAQALTLSRPQVQSKQGEALRAEIDIIDLIHSEEVELQASLASPEAYRAAHMELPRSGGTPIEVLIQLQKRPDGRLYLKISSPQAINTNFVDLLLVFQWATGRSLRDVTLSLDDGRGSNTKPTLTLQTPTGATSSQDKASSREANPSKTQTQDDTRVTVRPDDTASVIAQNNLVSGVSLDQMLLALLRNNPTAFIDSNVNRLKSGALLTLPSAQEASSVSREEAHKTILIQAEEFREYRTRLAAAKLGGEIPKAARASEGKLNAQVSSKSTGTQDKLTLTKPSKDAPEEKVAKQLEVQDVATRTSEISQNIADLSKLVAAATASSASDTSAVAAKVVLPKTTGDANKSSLKTWISHPFALWGAAGLLSIIAILAIWLSRGRKKADLDNSDAPAELITSSDLDLPDLKDDNQQRTDLSHVSHLESAAQAASTASESPAAPTAVRPDMTMPNVSLDIETASDKDPFQVRIDWAEELWKQGQHHTSRALMEEVMQESTGATQAQAKQWLADRN